MALICAGIILSKRFFQFFVQSVPSTFHRLWAEVEKHCFYLWLTKTGTPLISVNLWSGCVLDDGRGCGKDTVLSYMLSPQYEVSTYGHFSSKQFRWCWLYTHTILPFLCQRVWNKMILLIRSAIMQWNHIVYMSYLLLQIIPEQLNRLIATKTHVIVGESKHQVDLTFVYQWLGLVVAQRKKKTLWEEDHGLGSCKSIS